MKYPTISLGSGIQLGVSADRDRAELAKSYVDSLVALNNSGIVTSKILR